MSKDQAWRVWEKYVGNGASRSDFINNGKIDENAISEQIEYARREGWLKEISSTELQTAVRLVVEDYL